MSSVFRNKDINDGFHVIEIANEHTIEISSITMASIEFYKPINEFYARILFYDIFLRWRKQFADIVIIFKRIIYP